MFIYVIAQVGPGCTSQSSVVIEYRLSDSPNWTRYPVATSDTQTTVQLPTGGTYDVRVTVTNQGGVSDTTQTRTLSVQGVPLYAYNWYPPNRYMKSNQL